jgi:hypothetical protein
MFSRSSGHKLESSQTRVFVWFYTYEYIGSSFLVSQIFKMIIKTKVVYGFLQNPSRRDCEKHGAKDSSLLLNGRPRIPSQGASSRTYDQTYSNLSIRTARKDPGVKSARVNVI